MLMELLPWLIPKLFLLMLDEFLDSSWIVSFLTTFCESGSLLLKLCFLWNGWKALKFLKPLFEPWLYFWLLALEEAGGGHDLDSLWS